MIEEHLDPTVEAHTHITNLLRTLVTAAAGTAERRAQQRAQHLHDAQRRSDQQRRHLEQRTRAERQAAELVYRPTYQHTWWARARPEGIADAVTAAATWAASDPGAAHALRHIAGQLHDRHGIDLHDLQGASDPVGVADAVRDRLAGSDTPGVRWSLAAVHKVDPAAAPWDARSAVVDAAGPVLGAEILAAEGWEHLYQRLDALHHAGVDVPSRLRQAIGARELDTAKDKAGLPRLEAQDPTRGKSRSRPPKRHRRSAGCAPLTGRRDLVGGL